MEQPIVSIIFCGVLLGVAVCTDLIWYRIPNLLTMPACLAGVIYHVWVMGLAGGLIFSLAGLGTGLAILILPFLMGGMGGGDVKLLAALGSWLGACAVFSLFLYAALAGGIIALIVLFKRMGFKGIKRTVLGILLDLFTRQRPMVEKKNPILPYSIPIALGYVAYLFMGRVI